MARSTESLASNARLLLVMNVFQKLVTFTLNQVMVVTTTPEVMGQAAIQLELLLSTLLFLSREGIRLASLRERVKGSGSVQEIVTLSWLPPVVVLVFTMVIAAVREYNFPSYDSTVVHLYCVAAFVECLGEPCYNLFQNSGNIRPRLSAEMSAVTAKSATTVICVAYFGLGVTGFGIAQVVYSVIYVSVLLAHFISSTHTTDSRRLFSAVDLLPTARLAVDYTRIVTSNMFKTAITLTGSSLLKHLLTESDKIALTLTATTYNQGIYAVTNNYGSLAARIIFLPLEDSSRLAFAKEVGLVQDASKALIAPSSAKQSSSDTVDRTAHVSQYHNAVSALKATLLRLLRLVGFIGLFFAVFGIPYAPVAVQYVLSRQWRSAETSRALQMYCLYLLVMGINGITEAFVQSAAPPSAFATLNMGLIMSSVSFVACAVTGVAHLGTSGIILASVISMVVRIINNGRYALKMFAQPQLFVEGRGDAVVSGSEVTLETTVRPRTLLAELRPPAVWVGATILCGVVVNVSAFVFARSSQSLKDVLVHFAVGACTAALFLLVSFRCAPEDSVSLIANRVRILSKLRRCEVSHAKDN
jgi:oligosaccharide translocation protein RFT1